MKRRPPTNDQNGGNPENSNPIAPNHVRLGPQKRIEPRHAFAPAKKVSLANCYGRADFTGNRAAQVNWLSLSERIRWQ